MKLRKSTRRASPTIKQEISEEYIHKRSQSPFDDHGLSQVKDALTLVNFILGQDDPNTFAKCEEPDTNASILNEPDTFGSTNIDGIRVKQEDVTKPDIDAHGNSIITLYFLPRSLLLSHTQPALLNQVVPASPALSQISTIPTFTVIHAGSLTNPKANTDCI